ncbi:penicillin-binding protein 2 [Clostridia bacterium]|nr:penicillin-binding protein 2 [Clostridia bacterium]
MNGLIERRFKILSYFLAIVVAIMVFKLAELQIVKGAAYQALSESRTQISLPVKAPRGEIFDRYGRPLVTNRMGFSIVLQKESIKKDQLNVLIGATIDILAKTGDIYIDSLPIDLNSPYKYIGDDDTVNEFLTFFKKPKDTTSDEMLTFLADRYAIANVSDKKEIRRIAGVRYEMEKRMFGVSAPYTFATDVSANAVTILKEQRDDFAGVNIVVDPIREYTDGTLAAHILGRVGVIYAEEYATLKTQGYSMTDTIGKDGIEKVLEQYLRGQDGIASSSGTSIEPIAGDYGILTLDSVLQRTLEKSLANTIYAIRGNKDVENASAGAGVVIDVNSGEILAMANYPSFNLNTFNKDYNALAANPNRPMFNRAIGGAYEPGSTFKMLTAVAGLEEGVISLQEQIIDEGVYRAYEQYNYTPVCWIWADNHSTHGLVNVSGALKVSCNYFFYEVGRRLGIDKLVQYGKNFGIGQLTGVEISGETAGILASPEYRKKIGKEWYVGDTLQAAIGQSDNLVTPLQLANYVATIANGGTLYNAHLVKGIKSYTTPENNITFQPEVRQTTPIKAENYSAIMQGMKDASEGGTAANVFSNYPISVGSKTGTASVSKGAANAVFVAVAPLEKPEIAVAIVVEHGAHGNYVAPVARDVFDEYFKLDKVSDPIDSNNVLLN